MEHLSSLAILPGEETTPAAKEATPAAKGLLFKNYDQKFCTKICIEHVDLPSAKSGQKCSQGGYQRG